MNDREQDSSQYFIFRILILALLLVPATASSIYATDLIILYSNDIRGDTEPCG